MKGNQGKGSGRKPPITKPAASAHADQPRAGRRLLWLALALLAIAGLAIAGLALLRPSPDRTAGLNPPAFVGSETCATCHEPQAAAWRGSHHRHAMAHANETTVLGDFNDARFEYYGIRSRFFRRDGQFMVETDGPDGTLQSYEIKYTFGVEPLQQYLIEFPDGRVQALSIAWDTRPKEKGGQRWFHLYPGEKIDHTDVLHWTKLNQNWNFMCAECHSTGVRKNYDANSDRFRTSFAEISVGCEACHGQGSRHVAWARNKQKWWPDAGMEDTALGLLVRYAERLKATWPLDPDTGSARRSEPPASLRTEVETCGFCHARRAQFSEDWKPGRPLSETHQVSLLSRGLFHADGQMRDEVFNYASFKQSRMFAAGVTCSDCHDPHSAKLRLPGEGVCLQCHSGEKFAAPAHHRHADATPALACSSCHMPVSTYMVVDDRHDHGFRIPRPDLSITTGAPNACNDCHKDKPAAWAAAAIEAWHGPTRKGFQTYAPAFSAAWANGLEAGRLLAAIASDPAVPGIARATALAELGDHLSPALVALARSSLADPDPLVRLGALDMLERVPAVQIRALLSPLLRDPVRGVRMRAAQLLASIPLGQHSPEDRRAFEAAALEFVAAQRLNADRPEARSALGAFYARIGSLREAEEELKAALRLSASFAPAAINLADLYRQAGRDADGEAVLRQALAASPQDAALHHARGLTLVRLKRLPEAIESLGRAHAIDPGQSRYAYVYAVALHSSGRPAEALDILKQTAMRHPTDRETLMALVTYAEEAGDLALALRTAEQLSTLLPANRDIEALVTRLKQKNARP